MKTNTLFLGYNNLDRNELKRRNWQMLSHPRIKLLCTPFGLFVSSEASRHGITFSRIRMHGAKKRETMRAGEQK